MPPQGSRSSLLFALTFTSFQVFLLSLPLFPHFFSMSFWSSPFPMNPVDSIPTLFSATSAFFVVYSQASSYLFSLHLLEPHLLFKYFLICCHNGPFYFENSSKTSVYNICSFLVIDFYTFHVTHPYKRTLLTFVMKILNFVLID